MATDAGRKWRWAGAVAGTVVVADALTKAWVRTAFQPGETVPILGDAVRLTYVLNPGAAFGIHVGDWSRPVFTALALGALAFLVALLHTTSVADRARIVALALVAGGAVGNLLDRVMGPGAVVDFLDVGFGAVRWPVFNLADVGVTTGAVLLVVLLWSEEEPRTAPGEERAARADPAPG